MKAAVFKNLGAPLEIEGVRDPVPAGNEVVVQISHCGICGSDLHTTEDQAFGAVPGTVLGHEYSGEIVEVGTAASRFRAGDRVSVMPLRGCGLCANCMAGRPSWCSAFRLEGGGYAEYSLAAEHQCVRLPKTISLEDAALAEPLAVALHGVALSELKMGAKVLVLGAGPIGLGVAFWARRLGAAQIAVSDLFAHQADRAHTMGATSFLGGTEGLAEKVNAALGGSPDIVFECVGKPGMVSHSIGLVRPRGTVVLLGLCTAPDSFIPFEAVNKEVRLQTSAFFHEQEFCAAIDALDAGHAAPRAMITDTVALEKMPQVFEALRTRTHQCKVLVSPR